MGFAGQYTDAETGFVYLRARYYDPATGRFISRDPLMALTGSAYAYVDGNPLNLTDPTGLCILCLDAVSNGLKVAAIFAAGMALAPEAAVVALTAVAVGASVAATAIDCRDSIRTGSVDFKRGVSTATTLVGMVSGGFGVAVVKEPIEETKILTAAVLFGIEVGANVIGFLVSTLSFLPANAEALSPEGCLA